MGRKAIDLNCDMGESYGAYTLGYDKDVIKLITSANVACGFHAGDAHVMHRTVELACACGVRIGAHPGLPDLLGFGRRRMAVTADEVRDFFIYQVGSLKGFVEAAGQHLQHVKAHGALLDMGLADESLTRAMCKATKDAGPDLIWVTPSGTTTKIAREYGLKVVEEFYADRAYNPDLSLVSRKREGAVIHDIAQIKDRLVQLFEAGTVTTIEGLVIPMQFESICVHGDTPDALEIIRLVRKVCAEKNVAVRPMCELAH